MLATRSRAVFISDVHLGTPDCKVEYLLDFLSQIETHKLYLVGDIIDLIAMRRRVHFNAEHEQVIAAIMKMACSGTEVIYIPGNHDAMMRRFVGQKIAGIKIQRHATHQTLDGRRFFVSHGDEFDSVMQCSAWLNRVGDLSHGVLVKLNTLLNMARKNLRLPYWSLAGYVKKRIAKASAFIETYEGIAAKRASETHYDGYICGHIHHSALKYEHGILYCNDGDWVEHCTALIEDPQGQFSLVHWSDHQSVLQHERELQRPDESGEIPELSPL